jgi:hypothetical protein
MIASDLPDAITMALTQQVLSEYEAAYEQLAGAAGARGAELLVELAAGLAAEAADAPGLRNAAHATALLDRAIDRFLRERSAAGSSLWSYAVTIARKQDLAFLIKVARTLGRLDRKAEAEQMSTLCATLAQRSKAAPPERPPDPFIDGMKDLLRTDQPRT